MTNQLRRLPICVAVAIVAVAAVSWASAKTDWEHEAQSRKAEYIFLEAQSAYAQSEYDRYVALLDRAYSLDSTDIDIAGEWATLTFMEDYADSAALAYAYSLIKRRFELNPSNYTSGLILANLANQQGRYADAVSTWETLDRTHSNRPDIAQQLAHAYLRAYLTGDSASFDKAMSIYDRMQLGSGRSIDLASERIQAYSFKGDTLAITQELDSLYASAPNDSYTSMFLGATYQYLNMPDEAIKYYNRACELDSTNGAAYLSRAKFYSAQGDSVAFDREVFVALKSHNLDVDSKIDILRSYVSELYTDSLQEPRIRQLFNELQLMHSGEPEIHTLYGAYLYERKDYRGSSEQFSYVTALTPNDESAWTSYLQVASMAEDTTAIINSGKEAMERFPDNLLFPIMISNVYRINDDNKKALDILDSVNITTVNNPTAVSSFLTAKADLYTLLGDTIKGLDTYTEAININPDNAMAMNNAAYFIALSGGDLDLAERYSARSLQDDELNPTYLDTYAWIFFKKKDFNMAKHYIDIALNSYAYDRNTESESMDANDKNTNEIETVINEYGEPTADIFDHAGDIYFMTGDIEQAIKFWEKAHELEPDNELIARKVKYKTIFFK